MAGGRGGWGAHRMPEEEEEREQQEESICPNYDNENGIHFAFFFFFLHCSLSGIFLASFLLYSFMPTFYFIIIIVVVLVQSFSSFWLCLFVIPILISLSSSSLLLKVSICHIAFTFHLLHLSVLNLQKWIALVPICSPQDTVWTRCVLACVHLWACVCMCVYESNRPKWQTVLTSLWLT